MQWKLITVQYLHTQQATCNFNVPRYRSGWLVQLRECWYCALLTSCLFWLEELSWWCWKSIDSYRTIIHDSRMYNTPTDWSFLNKLAYLTSKLTAGSSTVCDYLSLGGKALSTTRHIIINLCISPTKYNLLWHKTLSCLQYSALQQGESSPKNPQPLQHPDTVLCNYTGQI